MVIVPLTKGQVAIIDDRDADRVLAHKWHATDSTGNGDFYAARFEGPRGNQQKIYMHRFIMNLDNGDEVDHQDENKLNNRRDNLAVVSKTENIKRRTQRRQRC